MSVPHEREDTDYNVHIDVVLPDGWTAVSCQTKCTWTCDAHATVSGSPAITRTKQKGAAPAQDETFHLTVHAPAAAGQYAFKTLQTYETGDVVRWIGPPDSDEPAPQLTVVAAASQAPAPAPSATSTRRPTTATTAPVSRRSSSTSAAPSLPGAAGPSARATASTTPSPGQAQPSTSPGASAAPSTASSAPQTGEHATTEPSPSPAATDQDGGAGWGWIAAAVGLAGAALLAFLPRRRMRTG